MMKISMSLSMITPFMKHPMSMGFMLINQTIMLSMIMTKESKMSWYSYILFLTMIGGMMIMFMYMSSVASNEKFNLMPMKTMMIIILTITLIIISKDQTIEILQSMEMEKFLTFKMEQMKSTTKFFNFNKMNITITMMITLLLTMISVTNICSTFEGPLKKK